MNSSNFLTHFVITLQIVILIISVSISYSQLGPNLVRNPSFEDTVHDEFGNEMIVNAQNQVFTHTKYWRNPNNATPDLFRVNAQNYMTACWPPSICNNCGNIFGAQSANIMQNMNPTDSGKSLIGLFYDMTFDTNGYIRDSPPSWFEYVQQRFEDGSGNAVPLERGTTYYVSFYASLADKDEYRGEEGRIYDPNWTLRELGVYFEKYAGGTYPPFQNNTLRLYFNQYTPPHPQILPQNPCPVPLDEYGYSNSAYCHQNLMWVRGRIVTPNSSDGEYTHFTIGLFEPQNEYPYFPPTELGPDNGYHYSMYYFIDAVEIRKIDTDEVCNCNNFFTQSYSSLNLIEQYEDTTTADTSCCFIVHPPMNTAIVNFTNCNWYRIIITETNTNTKVLDKIDTSGFNQHPYNPSEWKFCVKKDRVGDEIGFIFTYYDKYGTEICSTQVASLRCACKCDDPQATLEFVDVPPEEQQPGYCCKKLILKNNSNCELFPKSVHLTTIPPTSFDDITVTSLCDPTRFSMGSQPLGVFWNYQPKPGIQPGSIDTLGIICRALNDPPMTLSANLIKGRTTGGVEIFCEPVNAELSCHGKECCDYINFHYSIEWHGPANGCCAIIDFNISDSIPKNCISRKIVILLNDIIRCTFSDPDSINFPLNCTICNLIDGVFQLKIKYYSDNNGQILLCEEEIPFIVDCPELKNSEIKEIDHFKSEYSIKIIPFPAMNNFKIIFEIAEKSKAQFELINSLGSVVNIITGLYNAGENQIEYNSKGLQSGLYFIRMTNCGESLSVPFIIYNE